MTETRREYCQLETFSPRCPSHDDVIVIKSATFGRMRVGRCIDADSLTDSLRDTLGCQADVIDYVSGQCSGQTSCDIFIPNRELLNFRPCSNQLTMYLEAAYSCLSGYPVRSVLIQMQIFFLSNQILFTLTFRSPIEAQRKHEHVYFVSLSETKTSR